MSIINVYSKLFMDPMSFAFLVVTQLDFVKVGLNDGFELKNPYVKNEFGCCERFHV